MKASHLVVRKAPPILGHVSQSLAFFGGGSYGDYIGLGVKGLGSQPLKGGYVGDHIGLKV